MRSERLLTSSIRGLWQPLLVGAVFAVLVWVMAALRTGSWAASLREALPLSTAPALVLAALVGPLQASVVRSKHYAPVLSLPSIGLALFAAVWAAFWVLPFNLVILAKHGIVLPPQENLTYVAVMAVAGFCLSFFPARA
jgi:hypothetical protein